MKDIKHLLPITTNEKGTQALSGRDLHSFLEVKGDFRHWINRMIEYGFEENIDYVVSVKNDRNLSGGRPSKDIIMILDMAKEVAMIQRTERGKQARQYFIESEKQLQQVKSQHVELPTTPQAMTKALLENMNANNEDIKTIKHDVDKLQNTMRINGNQEKVLLDIHHKSAFKALGGKESNAYKNRKLRDKTFRSVWSEFKKVFYLPRYGELQQVRFDDGKEFLEAWQPNTELRLEIQKVNDQGTLF